MSYINMTYRRRLVLHYTVVIVGLCCIYTQPYGLYYSVGLLNVLCYVQLLTQLVYYVEQKQLFQKVNKSAQIQSIIIFNPDKGFPRNDLHHLILAISPNWRASIQSLQCKSKTFLSTLKFMKKYLASYSWYRAVIIATILFLKRS